MILFTLADGSYLLLHDDCDYQVVDKKLMIQGCSPAQEAHRLEETAARIAEAAAKMRNK